MSNSSVAAKISEDPLRHQQRYWNELVQMKFQGEYVHHLVLHDQTWNRRLDILLATASTGSIGGWIVWANLGFVWAAVIVTAHVVAAVRPVLPFGARPRALSSFQSQLTEVLLRAERRWFEVSEGFLSEQEIHELRLELKSQAANAEVRCFGENPLPRKRRLLDRAEETTDDYFRAYYGGQDE